MFRHALLAILFISSAFIFSCTFPFEQYENGQVQLSFSASSAAPELAQALSDKNPQSILLSVENDAGQVMLSDHKMDLLRFGSDYVTESLSLPVGDYQLTQFFCSWRK